MGKVISRSVLGDYSGTVGTVVLSMYRGIPIMKGRPRPSRKAASPQQLGQREIFKIVTAFFRPEKSVINIGFQQPGRSKHSPMNAAVSYHMKNAIGGAAGNPYLELSKLRLTQPRNKTQSAWNSKLSVAGGYTINVDWELNPFPQKCAQTDDKVFIVVYNNTTNRFDPYREHLRRADLSYSHTYPKRYEGNELHFYMFLVSEDGKLVSETEYLGMVIMQA
ncbi:MAG: DUF6266 family protein [Pedobacter sp.]|uniref:DUF6266 family protein n=1 Tax=Pedobacter sp. TaxID=1411316 RepID=UPI0033915E93